MNHKTKHDTNPTSRLFPPLRQYGMSPSNNLTDSEMPLTHGHPLLYSRLTVLIQYHPPFIYLNCQNDGRTSCDCFLSATDLDATHCCVLMGSQLPHFHCLSLLSRICQRP